MRRTLFLVLMWLSFGVSAQTYYWTNSYVGMVPYPSPQAVADADLQICLQQADTRCRITSVSKLNETQFQYSIQWNGPSHGSNWYSFRANAFINRYGDQCDAGTEYNPQTGECESDDPCGDKLGQEFNFSISGVGSTDYMFISESGQFSAPSQAGCFNGCTASTVDQSCQVRSLGPWRCGGVAVYTGAECGQGGITIENSDTLDKPVSELTTDSEPCNYITGPGGEQTCTSVQTEELRGQTCGTFNGETICPQIQPELESTQIDTTVTTEDNGDGTTTTTKVDIATVTSCTGASCNTTTTTNTTVNNNGNITSSCTGPRCATGSNPDGNGDGFGDGDGGVIGQPGLGEFGEEVGEFSDSVDAFMNRVSDAPVMSALDSIGGSAPAGNCSIGATSVWFFEFDAGPIFCDMAPGVLSPLYPLFLAIWAFAAVRILFSA